MPFPLKSLRLTIEPLTLADAEAFVRYRQDPAVARFQGWDMTYSSEQAVELIESQAGVDLPALGEWVQLAVRDRHNGALIGDVALHTLAEAPYIFEIGFTLATENQGQGFAREAVRAVLSYLFGEVGAASVRASSDRRNVKSIRLLSALGFQPRPDEGWTEQFKGETVQMVVYQLVTTDSRPPDAID